MAYFQPQVDAVTRRIVAMEALARWNHPEFGMILPSVFIPLAEENDLIAEIGTFMFDEACRCAADWTASGYTLSVSVNVSADQLHTSDLLDHVADGLARYSLPADVLVLEVTESLPLVNVPEVTSRLSEMRALGLGISVDDFGMGYSSVARLAQAQATEVKIDKSRVQNDELADPFLRDVMEMARDHQLRVVAEGVETEAQYRTVRDLGVDRAQGYLFGHPLPELETTRLLASA